MEFYLHFNLDMGRSPGFGSNITDFIRPIQTRSRCGSGPLVLNLASYINSPDHSTIGTRSPFDGLSVLVSTRFQVLFHSPPGVLFTFPSRYCFTIGHQVVFSLGRWSSLLPTRFHVSRGTLDHNSWSSRFTYRTITFYGGTFQFSSVTIASTLMLCPQPRKQVSGLGSFPFARRY